MNMKAVSISVLMIVTFLASAISVNATDATAGSIEVSGAVLYDNQDVMIHLYSLQASKYYTVYSYDGTTTTLLFNTSTNAKADDIYLSYKVSRPTSDTLQFRLYPQSGSTGTLLGNYQTSFQDPFNLALLEGLAISALPVVVIVGLLASIMTAFMLHKKGYF